MSRAACYTARVSSTRRTHSGPCRPQAGFPKRLNDKGFLLQDIAEACGHPCNIEYAGVETELHDKKKLMVLSY